MANENKKTNELVDDDDSPTSELEALTDRQFLRFGSIPDDDEAEADAKTFDIADLVDEVADSDSLSALKADLQKRSETIERLQYDIAQLHSRWLGLETEIKAREELTERLTGDLKRAEDTLARRDKSIAKRDRKLKDLKAEIREREQSHRELLEEANELRDLTEELSARDDIDSANQALEQQAGQLASERAKNEELRSQLERTEAYADELRRGHFDLAEEAQYAHTQRQAAADTLADSETAITAMTEQLQAAREELDASQKALEEAEAAHAEEVRRVRFELGEAQETLAQNEEVSEQLASDLVDSRTYRDQLEKMLLDTEDRSQSRIEELEQLTQKLEAENEELEQKLEAKGEAINCLLGELSRKSQEMESIGEMEDVIQEIDDRMSERIDEPPLSDKDRTTRLLIGRIGTQELRFPLFKDRLTIGRTSQNDIQLKAHYISRRHAVIVTEGDTTRVIDWGSKNGVFVNSKQVKEHFLSNGDILTIGTVKFRYEERPKRDA
ncbi:MAG: FHA domain-containing protein [Woeseiaceae bacterium]|nr:FHA domain-containing protein [Woeseiaceae bacterium]